MALTLAIGQATDPGRVRQSNEDNLCVLQPPFIVADIDTLVVVADGMGGHNAGEIASGFVTEKLGALFRSPDYRKWVDFSPVREDYYVLVLKEILEKLNDQLYQMAARREEWHGMGTTVTAGLIVGNKMYLGHAGDSRAYLLSQTSLRQLTKDHAWVMEQVAQGLLSPEQAAAHPRKNEITRAIGISSLVRVDRFIQDLSVGDALLLCTDGLTNLVSDSEIQQHLQSIADPQQCCQSLVNLANQRGGGDNITVVVVRVVSESSDSGVVVAPPVDPAAAEVRIDTEPISVQPRHLRHRSKRAQAAALPVPEPQTSQEVNGAPASAPSSMADTPAEKNIGSLTPAVPATSASNRSTHTTQTARESSLALFLKGFAMMGYVILASIANAAIVWYLDLTGADALIQGSIVGALTLALIALGILGVLFGFSSMFNRR
jgi:protein phosphatase